MQMTENKLIVVIRVRGMRGARQRVKTILEVMHLSRKHACVFIKSSPSSLGMLKLAKDYITWGDADEKTVELLNKKGKAPYALHPARGGMGQIKQRFPRGALGNRGAAINELIARMV